MADGHEGDEGGANERRTLVQRPAERNNTRKEEGAGRETRHAGSAHGAPRTSRRAHEKRKRRSACAMLKRKRRPHQQQRRGAEGGGKRVETRCRHLPVCETNNKPLKEKKKNGSRSETPCTRRHAHPHMHLRLAILTHTVGAHTHTRTHAREPGNVHAGSAYERIKGHFTLATEHSYGDFVLVDHPPPPMGVHARSRWRVQSKRM